MADISDSFGERRVIDYAMIAVAGAAVLGFLGVGFHGTMVGFVQSEAYYKANDIVGVICAALSAGCALYLAIEFTGRVNSRGVLAACIVCGMFGFFAVSKGVPAVVTASVGKPGIVAFTVDRFDGGGKNCPRTVVGVHKGYEDLRVCVTAFDHRNIQVGFVVEVRGMISNWGIVREQMRILH